MREGVPASAIHPERKSRNTWENIRFAIPILEEESVTEISIVTDAYHMPRALMVARRCGLSASGDPVPWDGARPVYRLRQNLREYGARASYYYRLRRGGPADRT